MQAHSDANKPGFAAYLRKCFIVAVSAILAVSLIPIGGIEAVAAPANQTQNQTSASQPDPNDSSNSGSNQGSNQDNLGDGAAGVGGSGGAGDAGSGVDGANGVTAGAPADTTGADATADENGTTDGVGTTTESEDAENLITPLSIPAGDLTSAITNNTVPGLDPAGATVNLFDYTVIPGAGTDTYGYQASIFNTMTTSGINAGHALLFGNLTSSLVDGVENNAGGRWNQGGDSQTANIVKPTLTNGYPTLNDLQTNNASAVSGRNGNESLAYLFNPDSSLNTASRTSYTDVQGLFQLDQNTGNYYYDSSKNFAEADVAGSERKFRLWNLPAVQHNANQGNFFPFNTGQQVFNYDAATGNVSAAAVSSSADNLNHYFGMTLSVPFRQPIDGKTSATDPMKFSFTGDDDVWVYIDDVLVADLGGMHGRLNLDIDFSTGVVTVNGQTHTLRDSFVVAGCEGDFTSGFNPNTFASNSAHTLKMFYLERGGWASNLALSFNLQPQLFQQIRKVDQDGNPVQGAQFDLYESNANYEVPATASPVLSGIETDADGYARFAMPDGDPFNFSDRYDAQTGAGHYYVLRETRAPGGYKSLPTDLQLEFLPDTTMLRVANRYDAGAFASFNSYVTGVTGNTHYGQMSAGGGLATAIPGLDPVTEDAQKNGLVVAVPMLKHERNGQTTWNPLYGNTLDVLSEVDYTAGDLNSEATRDAARGAALEAALRQAAGSVDGGLNGWYLTWSPSEKRLTGTLESLPGRPDRYLSQNGGDASKSDMRMMYCLIEPAALARALNTTEAAVAALTPAERYAQLGAAMNGALNQGDNAVQSLLSTIDYVGAAPTNRGINVLDISSFARTFRSVIYIPNEQRELRVWKVDNTGARLDGCVFALFDTEATARAAMGATVSNNVVTSITLANGSTVAPGTGDVVGAGVTGKPDVGSIGTSTADNQNGTLVFAPYVQNATGTAQTTWLEADGSDPTGKMMYLKEVSAPEGYAVNPTVIPVVIGKYGIYADAGIAGDGVQVLAGVGKLNATMRKYAASPNVNLTLRYITATLQRQASHGDTLDFDAFNAAWKPSDPLRTMNLEYGKNALVDYGSPTNPAFTPEQIAQGIGYPDALGNQRPLFVSDVGYVRTAVTQNTARMEEARAAGAEYAGVEADNLAGQDLTGLFMIRNTVRVEDKSVPELLVTNRVVPEGDGIIAPDATFSFDITATGKADGVVDARVMEYKDTQWVPTGDLTTVRFTGGHATITLKHGQGLSILGLPENAAVQVVESDELTGVPADPADPSANKLMTKAAWDAKKTKGFAFRDVALNADASSAPETRTLATTLSADTAQTTITWTDATAGAQAQSVNATAVHFVNQYRVVQPYTSRVEITKTLENRAFADDDEFVFALTPAPFANPNDTVPMPAGATPDAQGALTYVKHWAPAADQVGTNSAHFPIIAGTADAPDPNDVTVFTEPGTYTYLVTEVRPSYGSSIAGISYDPSVYAITIEVTPKTENGVTTGFNIEPVQVRKSDGPSTDPNAYREVWAKSATSNDTEAYEKTNFVNTYNQDVIDPVIRGYKNLFGHEGTGAGAGSGDATTTADFEFVLEPLGAYRVPDAATKAALGDGTTLTPDQITAQLAGYTYERYVSGTTAPDSMAARQPMPGDTTAAATQSVTTKADSEGQIQFERLRFDKDVLGFATDAASELGVVFKYQVREVQPTQDGTFTGEPLEGATKVDTDNDGTPDSWNYRGTTYDPSTRTMYYYAHVDAVNPADPNAGTVIHVLRYGETPFSGITEAGAPAPGQRFTNTYAAAGDFTLEAEKILNAVDAEGNPIPSHEFAPGDHFEFVITRSDGAPALLDAAGNPVSRVTIDPTSGKSYAFAVGTAHFTQADIGKTYTYALQETAPGQAGMTYDTAPRVIEVTISDHGDGSLATDATMRVGTDSTAAAADGTSDAAAAETVPLTNPAKIAWTNTYNPALTSTGDLEITKKVVAPADDQAPLTADYHFTVYLTDQDDNPLSGDFAFGLAGATANAGTVSGGKAEFSLKDGQTMVIKNLPEGTNYVVEEAEANQNCTTTFENVGGDAADDTADGASAVGARMTVTNDFTNVPPQEFVEFDPEGGTGSVALTKTVAGDQGQTDKSFTFNVKLTNADGTNINGILNYSRDGKIVAGQLENGELSIPVAHGQTVVIGAIPVGAHFSITESEANQDGYTTTVRGAGAQPANAEPADGAQAVVAQGVVTENARAASIFVNTRGDFNGAESAAGSAKTGDTTPWMPIATLAVVALAVLGITAWSRKRKRTSTN